LFQPPIDPAMLVRAAAAGLDIGSVVSGVSLGNHRFTIWLQRAQALAGSVRGLGQALLSALEKRDAEAVALLRQTHEEALLGAVVESRKLQVSEAKEALDASKQARRLAEARRTYYDRLIGKDYLAEEDKAGKRTTESLLLDAVAATMSHIGSGLAWIPDVTAALPPQVTFGGNALSNAFSGSSGAWAQTSGLFKTQAGRLTTTASYTRRMQEWKHQRALAERELTQHDRLIAAADLRVEIGERELKNQQLQVSHSAEVRAWMETKYTKRELYDWMVSQLATVHFQVFQLAQTAARKAEGCYNHELGRSDAFIGTTHWDASRKGLLAGERLAADLDRMETAYLDNDVRELELVKHVSLQRLDPMALVRLRADGECYFEVPEALFDLDCPTHYNRRLMGVAVTVACVAGGQGQVNVALTMLGAEVRSEPGGDLVGDGTTATPRIVTSTAIEDSGVFSDARDGRYLPFERRGAVSTWHLAFTNLAYPQIDWGSVSDVVLHLRYTARDGGAAVDVAEALATLAGGWTGTDDTSATSGGAVVGLSARRDEPDAWFAAQDGATSTITVPLGPDRLPYFAEAVGATLAKVHVFAVAETLSASVTVTPEGGSASGPHTLGAWLSVWRAEASISAAWPASIDVDLTGSTFDQLEDLVVVLEFTVS
jgi:hypothetical protein